MGLWTFLHVPAEYGRHDHSWRPSNLGEGLCICTSFHFPDSGFYLLKGFDFYFHLF